MDMESSDMDIQYEMPNLALVSAKGREINEASQTNQYNAWPVLAQKLVRLAVLINQQRAACGEQLSRVSSALRSRQVQEISVEIAAIRASVELTEPQRMAAIASLQVSMQAKALSIFATLSQAAAVLSRGLQDIESLDITPDQTKLRLSLQQQLDDATRQSESLLATLKTLQADRELLSKALALMEVIVPEDYAKALLPTAEELSLVTLAEPEMALLKAGIRRLELMTGKLREVLDYQAMLAQREALDVAIAQANDTLSSSRARLQDSQAKLAALLSLDTVQDSRDIWVAEVRKVVRVLKRVIETVGAAESGVEMDALLQHGPLLQGYVDSIAGVTLP